MIEENIPDTDNEQFTEEFKPWGMEVKQFCMLMHLSQFAGFVVPFGGLILPIIMWSTNKEHSQLVDLHGKNIVNWVISSTIYMIIGIILIIAIIGIPILIAVGLCSLIFTIIGAIKANEGIIYKYPLSINFFN